MKENKYYKISDNIFTVFSAMMCALSLIGIALSFLPYNVIKSNEIMMKCNEIALLLETPFNAVFMLVSVFVQILFIVSAFKESKHNRWLNLIAVVLVLNIILEIIFVPIFFKLRIEHIFWLWVPPVLIIAAVIKRKLLSAA